MKYCLLDRDGIINIDKGYVFEPSNLILKEGIVNLLTFLDRLNYRFVIITNQSGIGRGYYDETQFRIASEHLEEKFARYKIKFVATYHCPHITRDNCECRKPKPGMFFEAIKNHKINIENSISIGDNIRDIIAARSAGIKENYLVNNLLKIDEFKAGDREKSFKNLGDLKDFLSLNNKGD
jgi:D-glycero-D-manno-heptose 1,7-bisphosphate phosphatase